MGFVVLICVILKVFLKRDYFFDDIIVHPKSYIIFKGQGNTSK